MWQKTPEELRQALSAPFANGDIDWRVSVTTRDKDKGLAVPYVTNRAIQNRLDDTVGIDGWQNQFVPWKEGKAQLCGISIYFGQQKQWLTKWDGADDSDFESVKGGLSDSMKRAAVEWGIGRYLYGMTQAWVRIEQHGKSFTIVNDERPRLDQAHENWVACSRTSLNCWRKTTSSSVRAVTPWMPTVCSWWTMPSNGRRWRSRFTTPPAAKLRSMRSGPPI